MTSVVTVKDLATVELERRSFNVLFSIPGTVL